MDESQQSPLILPLDSPEATLDNVGGKGASLARLVLAGLPVPPGFHVTTHTYRRYLTENQLEGAIISAAGQAKMEDTATLDWAAARIQLLIAQGTIPSDIDMSVRHWYRNLGGGNVPVAVRSSATAEDLPEMSFAGLQETYLNVRGGDNVLAAVKRCWGSLWTARAIAYRGKQGIPSEDVALAVVVQQLVAADASGILFTANPLTGARDQLMINSAWGLGEAIVGGLVTPDTLIVNKQTGALISQNIACKEVMTVRLPEGTSEEAVPAKKQTQPTLVPAQIAELTRLGIQIEQLYGCPMDIEWVLAGERIFIVQARPITALPEARPVLDWGVPRVGGKYARSSVIELLPDPLSPLFATLALPIWNHATRKIMESMGGRLLMRALPANRYVLVTVNDYAYYDFGMSAREAAPIVLIWPWLVPGIFRMLRTARERWAKSALPRYASVVSEWAARDLRATSSAQLLSGACEIVEVAADHYLAVQGGILPIAYMSEGLFTLTYNLLAKRENDPPALTFLLGFGSAPMQAEKSLYDLAGWARTQPKLSVYLMQTPGEEIVSAWRCGSAPIVESEHWSQFCSLLSTHLGRFGHAVYDLDFAKSLAADDPAPLLEALKYFMSGIARNPHERQAQTALGREEATQFLLSRLGRLRRPIFNWLVATAQKYAPLREDALMSVGLGWPVLRKMLREVGSRLAAAGAIRQPDDVFWLNWDEVQGAARSLDQGHPTNEFARVIAERHETWQLEQKVTPPVTLPLDKAMRVMGVNISRWMPARSGQAMGDTITGIAASPGISTGIARVIHGPGEFNQLSSGDILVAKITTPAWTPLFALAAGIVTDVGGPLSHSSIVAREYQIPAVLGTGVASERIQSGRNVTVDGDRGLVKITKNA